MKLAYMDPFIHHSGGTVCEPVDLPVNKRHLEMVYAHMRLSRQAVHGLRNASRPRAAIRCGSPRSCSARSSSSRTPSCTSLINANSPMVWDATMLGAADVYAQNNQADIITPFILSGAMSPVTVAGTLAQVLAEVLAGVSFVQLVRPGAPAIFGTFVSTLSMQSGAPTFGTPEAALAIYGAGPARAAVKMPFRTGGSLCASKLPDAQAAYESAQTLVPTIHGGANFVLHAAGWMEGGLASSYEKFVMDCDQLGMMHVLAKGIDLSENGQAHAGFPRSRAGRAFPRLRAHAGQFRDGILPLVRRRQQLRRAVGGGGPPRCSAARQQALEEDARRIRGAAASTPASTKRFATTSSGKKASMPDATH